MPYYGDSLPYYYGSAFSNHSSLMTGTGRSLHSPLSSSRYAPHLSTISESPLSALRRYSPAATLSSRPKRVIDTADIDVSTPRALSHSSNHHQRSRLRRDRPTIRIRSQALKDNPALREHYERHEKTVGELLVEKFLIKDKKPETDAETRPKLYHQVSLDSATTGKERDELQEALQKRITRRMTRRRSSADVQMDPEQLEREVRFAQAQADALDTLVAEEQAEIEVETRMGTLIRKNLVRSSSSSSVLGKHESQISDEDDEDEDEDARTAKSAKKVKKRKKTTDKPSPPIEIEIDSAIDPGRSMKNQKSCGETINRENPAKTNGKELIETIAEGNTEEEPISPTKGLKFKIEASNSVGDFSTLWINAEEQEKKRKKSQGLIEQYRDSVRLPAPKSVTKIGSTKKFAPAEEHQQIVVLPVKKRYVKDDSRHSVYLTLKAPKSTPEIGGTIGDEEIVEAVDSIDRPRKNGGVDDERISTTSLIPSTTAGQRRAKKVAKFRSKDIAESDIEVRSISESAGGDAGTGDGAKSKDGSAQKLSELVSVASDEDAKNTIDRSENRAIGKIDFAAISTRNTKVSSGIASNGEAIGGAGDSNFLPIIEDTKKGDSIEIDDGRNGGATARSIGAVNEDIKKVTNDEKKETKVVRPKIGKLIGESGKKIKRGAAASDETSCPKVATRPEGKKCEEEENRRIISPDRSASSTLKSLPNAQAIDSLEFAGNSSDLLKIREINGTTSKIVDSIEIVKSGLNDDLSVSRNISGKSDETNAKADEVDGLANFRKGKSKIIETIGETKNELPKKKEEIIVKVAEVDEKSKKKSSVNVISETPKILTPKRTNDNIFNFEEVNELPDKFNQSEIGENAADISDSRNERKNLPTSVDEPASGVMRPRSPDLKVVTDSPKKLESPSKNLESPSKNLESLSKKPIAPTANGEKTPKSPIGKSISSLDTNAKVSTVKSVENDISQTSTNIEKIADNSRENEKDSAKPVPESPKLTNGVRKAKPKSTEESEPEVPKAKVPKKSVASPINEGETSKPEVPKKTWKKPEITPISDADKIKSEALKKIPKKSATPPAEEGIDFWGEIGSHQIVSKPVIKLKLKETIEPAIEKEKSSISSEFSEPAVKFNPTPETSPPIRTKTAEILAGDEKRTNKIKKKKTAETPKKKEQAKPSDETIFERFINGDGGDGNKLQPQPQPQQSEKTLENDASAEKSCEILEHERLERNLSTIAEETLGSPVSEIVPKNSKIQDDIIALISRKNEEIQIAKLDPKVLVSRDGITEKTASTEILPSVESEFGVDAVTRTIEIPESKKSETFVPSIKIDEVPITPTITEANPAEVTKIIAIEDKPEEDQDCPGTPTNETVDDTPKNISKWNGRADLSLDEPDKDIGPEVYFAAKKAKKDGSKKKTSTKKGSGKKNSIGSSSPSDSPDSSKKKKIVKKKKLSTIVGQEIEKKTIFEERSESKFSNSSDSTLKPGGLHSRNSPNNSPRNSPKQRPLDLIKMFYTTPALLLTATPRDLSKVKRAKIKKKKHSTRTASASSDSTGSTRSTQSTGTTESSGSTEHEDDPEHKRISSTRSNDSGFDGSPRLSNCDMACHKKCEKLTGNLCGLNQKLVAEALQALKRAPSQSSDNQRNSEGSDHHHASGRITPPATNLPRFKKYTVMDFNFLKVLGKGSFGKVLLAELRRTDCVYAVKCLKKDVVLEDDDVECTLIERKVLTLATRHPYLCHLFCTFQTDSHLFFVMEYLNGGDLMFHIQKSGRFAECRARFYAAEIWSGLNFLHKKGIVYRDLKLDNVLLDFEGHIRIADFGMCKLQIFLDRTADTFCGTPDYMAPEIIKGLKYNQAVDWWSFGVLLYEMLTGQSPFSGCDEDELFWSICNERPFIPRYLSQEAMDVLVCLLEKDAGKRPPAHQIAMHPFFHALQWDRLERRQLEPPFKPALEHTLDTRYFDTAFTAERARLTPVPEQILTSMDQGVFRGFSYTNPNATD